MIDFTKMECWELKQHLILIDKALENKYNEYMQDAKEIRESVAVSASIAEDKYADANRLRNAHGHIAMAIEIL